MGGNSILKLGDAGILSAKGESGTDDKRKEEELYTCGLLKVWSEILKHFESPTFRLWIVVKNINGLSCEPRLSVKERLNHFFFLSSF